MPDPRIPKVQTCVCGTKIVFRLQRNKKTPGSPKPNPIELDPVPNGNVEVLPDGGYRVIPKGEEYAGPRHMSHFSRCDRAGTFRRK